MVPHLHESLAEFVKMSTAETALLIKQPELLSVGGNTVTVETCESITYTLPGSVTQRATATKAGGTIAQNTIEYLTRSSQSTKTRPWIQTPSTTGLCIRNVWSSNSQANRTVFMLILSIQYDITLEILWESPSQADKGATPDGPACAQPTPAAPPQTSGRVYSFRGPPNSETIGLL